MHQAPNHKPNEHELYYSLLRLNKAGLEKATRYISMYMDLAHRIAVMSHCKRLQVGAVLVKDKNILSYGWNGTPKGVDNCCEDENNVTLPDVIHAEDNLLRKMQVNHSSTEGSTMYLTHAPCMQCAQRIVDAEIFAVVFNHHYRDRQGLQRLVDNGVSCIQYKTQLIEPTEPENGAAFRRHFFMQPIDSNYEFYFDTTA